MELSQFITTTLLDIKKGVNNTNVEIAKRDGKVLGKDATIQYEIKARDKGIKFDVAVTVSSEKESGAGGKVRIAVVDIGGEKNSVSKEEYVSRISFEVSPFNFVG